jgi:uncharacterized protein YPO0396
MKTPWRFLADLVSRKPTRGDADKADGSAGIQALEYHPLQEESAALQSDSQAQDEAQNGDLASPAVVPDTPEAAYVLPDRMQTKSSTSDGLSSSVAFAEEIIPLDTSHQRADEEAISDKEPSENKRKTGARRFNQVSKAPTPTDTHSLQFPEAAPVAIKAVADEMSELDAEIQELRKQLAKKLSAQNRYLRQLLGRYDSK